MQEVIVYTKDWCGFCQAAKKLLSQLNIEFKEIDVTADQELFEEMLNLADGRQTVPQIFVDGVGIGGFTDLYQLVRENKFPPPSSK